jgi:hypothetical protein
MIKYINTSSRVSELGSPGIPSASWVTVFIGAAPNPFLSSSRNLCNGYGFDIKFTSIPWPYIHFHKWAMDGLGNSQQDILRCRNLEVFTYFMCPSRRMPYSVFKAVFVTPSGSYREKEVCQATFFQLVPPS